MKLASAIAWAKRHQYLVMIFIIVVAAIVWYAHKFYVKSVVDGVIAGQGQAGTPDANVAAFLKMIRVGEGTSGANGYNIMFTGATFSSFAAHPNQTHCAGSLCSTAAGAYQFLKRTWDGCKSALDLPDFTPVSQDKAAIYLIRYRGAIELVKQGRFEEAVTKCNREWASLPGSPYGQPTRTMAQAREDYLNYGGTIA